MFRQYEVWGVLDGHEELIECVGTLKEAELIAEQQLESHDEVYILEDTDDELKEVRRYQGL
jgi:cytochrome c-type biogenesis protein CcmE